MTTKDILKNRRKLVLGGWVVLIGLLGIYTAFLISGLPSLEQLEHPKPELAIPAE